MSEMIQVMTPDGSFSAYVAYPESTARAAVVVAQEIFGINADMRLTCEELASQGYVGVCPDLFWRIEPHVELSDKTETEWTKGFDLYKAFDLVKGIEDIASAFGAARTMIASGGRVGLMGYCMGGLMTFLAATRHPLDAAVAYYPGGTENHLEHARDVADLCSCTWPGRMSTCRRVRNAVFVKLWMGVRMLRSMVIQAASMPSRGIAEFISTRPRPASRTLARPISCGCI